jgi:hypothetical protein
MTERERLTELIYNSPPEYQKGAEGVADYLLANGVIVPPCKVGDVVYVLEVCSCSHHYGNRCSANSTRKNVKYLGIVRLPPTHHYTRCLKLFKRPFKVEYLTKLGKMVFLTKEEAEQALKERDAE